MPLILSQRYIGDVDAPKKYNDVEGVIYHYPRVYFTRVQADDQFIYYRPAKGTASADAGTYFGHGRLGIPFPDMFSGELRYVDIRGFSRFPSPVPARLPDGAWIETGTNESPQFQAAVRQLSLYGYHRILVAGGVPLSDLESLPSVDDVYAGVVAPMVHAPKDQLRKAETIPGGTGYSWRGGPLPNLAESAALQERARADHQRILRTISEIIEKRGGEWSFNNNIDLFGNVGEHRLLVEAKSLTNPIRAVDRMRYGMGQLFDYRVRYEAEVAGATPVLAFGTPPARGDTWIANILEANGIAFVSLLEGHVTALNSCAEGLPILD